MLTFASGKTDDDGDLGRPGRLFDTGRVWTSLDPEPELDGEGAGLKYGVGGGVRFQWGEAFLVRVDAAGSADGTGFYFGVNHAF